jgi:Tripartite tricarboxylate transporter TctB family
VTRAKSDRLAGLILLLVAGLWIAGVFWTIPGVAGSSRVGPRGFPLAMGVMLAGLSLVLILTAGQSGETEGERRTGADTRAELWALAATFGFLALYTLLLDLFGFLIATAVSTAAFLAVALRKRSPKLVAGVSLGLALAIWLILGKAMGVYLPRGSLIDLF